jgi:hypothetical protein
MTYTIEYFPSAEIVAKRSQEAASRKMQFTILPTGLGASANSLGLSFSFLSDSQQASVFQSEIRSLMDKWKRETRLFSSISKKSSHPAYREIIIQGHRALPFILVDLKECGPADWFVALTEITGENPITIDIAGNMTAMTEAWLEWGRKKGYLKG